jgi:hypothetical protein
MPVTGKKRMKNSLLLGALYSCKVRKTFIYWYILYWITEYFTFTFSGNTGKLYFPKLTRDEVKKKLEPFKCTDITGIHSCEPKIISFFWDRVSLYSPVC